MMKSIRAALAILGALFFCASPALAQTTETFSTYVLSLTAGTTPSGTEKMFAIQGGSAVTLIPNQLLSILNGDCSVATPPTIKCTKTNGSVFAASATTDATNAANITSGTLSLSRLALANGSVYIGNVSGVPASVFISGDCTITNIGTITCTKTNGSAFAASATTDATNATNISSGTINTARLPSPFTGGSISGNTSTFVTAAAGVKTSTHLATWDANGNIQDGGAAGAGTMTSSTINTSGLATQGGTCTSTTSINCTVSVTGASKTDEQTGSSTAVAVTPAQQQQHDSAAKAWVMFTGTVVDGAATINASYNVASVSRSSQIYTINFTTAFASTNYGCSVTEIANATNNGWGQMNTIASSSQITVAFLNGPTTTFDPVKAFVVCYGRQ